MALVLSLIVMAARSHTTHGRTLGAIEGYASASNLEARERILAPVIRQGSSVLPDLAAALRLRDGWRQTWYMRLWPKLPAFLRKGKAAPVSVIPLRRAAAQMIYDIGPAAARPLASSLAAELNDIDSRACVPIIRALEWSLPDSPVSVRALTNWLGKPSRLLLFGTSDSYELWPRMPQAGPLLVPWLYQADCAGEAAGALGSMGTNAVFALAELCMVATNGVAGVPPNRALKLGYAASINAIADNKAAGMAAVCRVTGSSGPAFQIVSNALSAKEISLRMAAARLVKEFESSERFVPALLPMLNATNYSLCKSGFDAIGEIGTAAANAAPTIRSLTYAIEVERAPLTREFARRECRLAQIRALSRIAPQEGREFIGELVGGVRDSWQPVEILLQMNCCSAEIEEALQPLLSQTNSIGAAKAAYILRSRNTNDLRSLTVLREAIRSGGEPTQLSAARWYWILTKDPVAIRGVIRQGLKSPNSTLFQIAAQTVGAMGDEGREFVPELKAGLWHADLYARQVAGKTLQKIAPEALPGVR